MIKHFLVPMILGGALLAQPGPGGPGGPGRPGQQAPNFDSVKEFLALTDSQIQALQQLRQNQAQAVQADAQQMRTKSQELQDKLAKGTDANTAGTLLLEIEVIRKRIEAAHTRFHDQAVNSLTAAQKTKLQQLADAEKLRDEIGQAHALNLLAYDGPRGMGPDGRMAGPGMGFGPGPGAAFGAGRGFGPPR
jgi:Spy/CpxP family protein refolding chaperone